MPSDDSDAVGTRGRAWTLRIDARTGGELQAVTATDAFADRSLEELRFEDTFRTFYRPYTAPPRPQRESEVVDAIGEIVLARPRWWEAFEEDPTELLLGVVDHATRETCRDAARHVLQWLTPAATRMRCDVGDNAEALRLSRLVDYWPEELAASVRSGDVQREQLPSETLDASDRYVMLAWTALRELSLVDACEWPHEWGRSTCPCWGLRPLTDSLTDRMMEMVDRFHRIPIDARTSHDPADLETFVRVNLVDAAPLDASVLVSALSLHLPTILCDMVEIQEFANDYLRSIIFIHEPAIHGIAPASVEGCFMRESVPLCYTSARPSITIYGVSDGVVLELPGRYQDQVIALHLREGQSLTPTSNVERLVHDIMPMFEKVLAQVHHADNTRLLDGEPHSGKSSWITTAERPALTKSRTCGNPSRSFSLSAKRIDVSCSLVEVPVTRAGTGSRTETSEWLTIDGLAANAAANAVVLVEQTNVSSPMLQVRYPSNNEANGASIDCRGRQSVAITLASAPKTTVSSKSSANPVIGFPACAVFRFPPVRQLDLSTRGRCVAAVLALHNPWAGELSSPPSQLLHRYFDPGSGQSAEEERHAHYMRHSHPSHSISHATIETSGSPTTFSPTFPLRMDPAREKLTDGGIDWSTYHLLSKYTNRPRWWTSSREGSPLLEEEERVQQRAYTIAWLEKVIKRATWRVVQTLTSSLERPIHADYQHSSESDQDVNLRDAVTFFVRLSMVHNLHQSLIGAHSADLVFTASSIVKLVEEYEAAEDDDAKHGVLGKFVGRDYPVQLLTSKMDQATTVVRCHAQHWSHRFGLMVEERRTVAVRDGWFSPVPDACVIDDMLVHTDRTKLVGALDSLRVKITADLERQPVILRLVDPSYYSWSSEIKQTLPTFSARQLGSVRERMDSTIAWNPSSHVELLRNTLWVPSEVSVDMEDRARFRSYINGLPLHSLHRVTSCVEDATTAFLPLFENVLTQLSAVESDPSSTPSAPASYEKWSLRGRTIQVVVEITEVVVGVDMPDGIHDKWHSCNSQDPHDKPREDGNVIATGIYFANIHNLVKPRVHFGLRENPDQECVGFIDGYTGRGAVHANGYARRFDPLRLEDPSQCGSMLLVVVHLVNPYTPMVSTANVSPQDQDTIEESTLALVSRFFRLPKDVHELIASMAGRVGLTKHELQELHDRHHSLIVRHPTYFGAIRD